MIRVLNLGAGVQSTTVALLSARGEIERPDCAVFAGTGWEPRAVYDHLAWLEGQGQGLLFEDGGCESGMCGV